MFDLSPFRFGTFRSLTPLRDKLSRTISGFSHPKHTGITDDFTSRTIPTLPLTHAMDIHFWQILQTLTWSPVYCHFRFSGWTRTQAGDICFSGWTRTQAGDLHFGGWTRAQTGDLHFSASLACWWQPSSARRHRRATSESPSSLECRSSDPARQMADQ